MASPGHNDLLKLKRLLRNLKGHPAVAVRFGFEADISSILVQVDSDFAGCRITRRSTCGGMVKWCGGLLKSWSKLMATIALSTGEAELGAIVKGLAEGDGIVALLKDFDVDARVMLESDAAAAVGITKRLGLGRVRHLAVADLWVQQKVRDGAAEVKKIEGSTNRSDLLTKPLDGKRLEDLLVILGVRRECHGECADEE